MPMRHVVRAEQDTDIAVKLGWQALSGATRSAGFAVPGQVPSQFLRNAFLRIDVAIDRFLTAPQFCAFMDHPVADLFGRPALFDALDHTLAQIGRPDQFALRGTALQRALVSGHPEVSRVLFGECIIRPEIAFDLSKDRRLVTLQNTRHLCDGDLCKPLVFDPASFLHAQLRVNGSHAIFLLLDNSLFSNRSRTSKLRATLESQGSLRRFPLSQFHQFFSECFGGCSPSEALSGRSV